MNNSQIYIGSENAVVLCVDSVADHHEYSGRFYHSYSENPCVFSNIEELLFSMEALFSRLVFPYPSTNERFFINPEPVEQPTAKHARYPEKREKIMKDEQLLMQHGDLGSFIIRVQHRQNSSWQGRITWIEKNETVYFRSVWEMMKLIENAIDTVSPREIEEEEPNWSESSEDHL